MFNFFNPVDIFKDKFNFKDDCYLQIGDFNIAEEEEVNEEDILTSLVKLNLESRVYSNFSKSKIIIKAFNFEDNLQISNFLSKKIPEINKGIEILKKTNKDVQIKVLGDIEISDIESIKVKDKLIQFKEKELIEMAYKEVSIEEVLILDLLDLVYLGETFLTRTKRNYVYITVVGQAISGSYIVKAKIGEKLETIFNELKGDKEKLNKIISGGFIKGIPRKSLEEKIEKDEKGLLFITEKEANIGEEVPCIRCGKCLKICDEKLNPTKLVDLYKRGDTDEFIKFGGNRCIECGLCTIVCPSNIEISHKIKVFKRAFKEKEEKKVRSESFV